MSELTLEALNADLAVMAKRKSNPPATDKDVHFSQTDENLRHWRHRRQNPRPQAELDKARKRRAPLPRPEDT